jgi:hypothetical protein
LETKWALCLSTLPFDAYLVIYPIYIAQVFFLLEEVQYPNYHSSLKRNTLHSLLPPNLDGPKLLQMCLDHESLKLDPKERRLVEIVNLFDVDL